MKIDLAGTTVLVTGSSSGIGEEIARGLALSGATVALHYNTGESRAATIVGELGNDSRSFQADLSRPQSAYDLFMEVVGLYGSVDMLVNNAGIFTSSPVDLDISSWLEDWKRTLAVNLTSAAVLSYAAIRHFRALGGGRIVHIASRAAFRGETEEYLGYGASKGGLVSLSRSIARSFGKQNILSFAIAPGFVRTRMTQEYLDAHEEETIERELSLNELTKVSDIAPIVVFIAGGMLDHATGCTIDINAGSYMR
jgi:3-oxoacyl-[acyl-carrier protein] reductase